MKKGGFIEAVTAAISRGSDNWEAEYYCADNFNTRKLAVYMHSRAIALGPEWSDLQHCIVMMSGGHLRRRVFHETEFLDSCRI